mgnify:FL=1
MNIQFVSRQQCQLMILDGFFEENDYDLISISDTNKEKELMKKYWLRFKKDSNAAIFLNFRDIEGTESGFTENKAKQIRRFVQETFKRKKNIIVHCLVGVSRSGAVAKWINNHYMCGDPFLDDYVGYNLYVYCVLDD